MSKPPAFQFYAKDFMDSTRFWDANACGLYIRCLCIQWEHGGIPADLKTLARGVGMDTSEVESLWPTVGPKFEQGDGGLLINRRLEAVRSRQEEVSEKRRNAAKARWDADANASTNAHANHVQRKEKEKGDDSSSEGEGREEGVRREVGARKFPFGYKFDFMDLDWPEWAGNQVRETWARFVEYRWTHPKGKFRFSSKRSAQIWLNRQAQQFDTGRRFVAALEVTMSKGWLEPVSPSDFKYPLLAELDSQTPPEKPEHNPFA